MTAVEVIDQSPPTFLFHLGGSRRMAEIVTEKKSKVIVTISPTTDYDYYATWSSAIASYLMQNGFQETYFTCHSGNSPQGYEADTEVEEIFYHDNVQVVLRKDASLYYDIFESIDPEFYVEYLWKSGPQAPNRPQITDIFNALYRAYHSKGN